MDIQRYARDRAREVAEVFYQSVHAIDPLVYTAEQQEAWAPTPVDYARWSARLEITQPWLACVDHRVAGFIELDAGGYIDCMYTHPKFQGQGVASALYGHVLVQAKHRNIKHLYVDASLIAKPFFERRGFTVMTHNTVSRNGVALVNVSMHKPLNMDS